MCRGVRHRGAECHDKVEKAGRMDWRPRKPNVVSDPRQSNLLEADGEPREYMLISCGASTEGRRKV